ncbi:MAG: hypothetical protein JJE18_07060 [Eubacteriaceae bacterium]|nr:hypothetical protein [Eubacteriaceae bacterium]
MRKKQAERLALSIFGLIIFALGLGAKMINKSLQIPFLDKMTFWLWIVTGAVFFLMVVVFFLDNRIYKGFRYFWNYWTITNGLELQMIDAGFGIQRSYFVELPRIQISFSDGFSSGVLRIRNALKFDRKLDDVVMSSALGKFIVERHHLTDDGNFYVYGLVDGSVSFKQTFETFADFLAYSKTIPTYKLFLDRRSSVKLQHCLLVGMTGSGKTYSLYSLLIQMLSKDVRYEIYYADPKGSSIAVIGSTIAEDRTAVDVERIIELLEVYVTLMRERKARLKERLIDKIEGDYSDFGMSPYVFICDEYASFASILASSEKKTRDKVKAMLYEIILQGRQLGFFVFLIMQKSDATLIDTALRDNIPLKIVLGNSEKQTYVTAFGAGVDIPDRNCMVGEGVFTDPVLAPEPKLVQCPYFKFDILQACIQARVV